MGCMLSGESVSSEYYSRLRKRLKTGDILLFSSQGPESCLIKWATCSDYTHIGMVVRCRHLKSYNDLYIWHAPIGTLNPITDIFSSIPKDGPQLNELATVLKIASGKVYIKRLRKKRRKTSKTSRNDPFVIDVSGPHDYEVGSDGANLLFNGIDDLCPCQSGIMDFMRRESKKSYETSKMELLLSAWDGPFGQNVENTSSYFCSELIAETYKEMGLLRTNEPSNEFVPSDFSSELELTSHYYLGNTIKVLI